MLRVVAPLARDFAMKIFREIINTVVWKADVFDITSYFHPNLLFEGSGIPSLSEVPLRLVSKH